MNPETNGGRWIVTGCLLAAVAVGSGAIGAHLLEGWLTQKFPEDFARRQELWETASRYLMYHSLGLILVGLSPLTSNRRRDIVGYVMLTGVFLFSGCLYGYVLTNVKPLVHIVPLGGFSMIISWLLFASLSYSPISNTVGNENGA